MRILLWADEAVTNLFDIASYYDRIAPDVADRILARITEAPRLLLERPLVGPPSGLMGLRKWPVRSTPFLLLYRASPSDIEIAQVVHAAQDWRPE